MSPRYCSGILFALLLALAYPAHAEFRDVLDQPAMPSPLARSTLLQAVTQAGGRLVAVGPRGHILYSDDNGVNWTQAAVPVSSDLTAAYFVSATQGWAVGHDGVVLATRDGGVSWTKQLDGRAAAHLLVDYFQKRGGTEADKALLAEALQIEQDGPDKPFLDVWFADANTGYVVGAFNMIFKTEDGGNTWRPLFDRTANPQRFHLYAIRPSGDALYIACEGGLLLRSRGGSDDFQAVPFPYQGSLFGLVANRGTLLVYGLRGNLFRSTDGGAHWAKVDTGERSALVGGAVGPTGRFSIVAQSGAVLTSDDDGQHFTPWRVRQPMPLTGVIDNAADHLMVVGFRGVSEALAAGAPQ